MSLLGAAARANTTGPVRVALYYDVVSPYSYLAFLTLTQYARGAWRERMQLTLHPVFLGGVMAASGNKAPATVPAKAAYMLSHDLPRKAAEWRVPLRQPSRFPLLTLKPMRVLTALDVDDATRRFVEPLTEQLWRRYWLDDADIADAATMRACCADAGLDDALAERVLARATDDDIKELLKRRSTELVEQRNAFGAPVFYVNDDDMYFGSDNFELFARRYALPWHGPVPETTAKL